MKIVVTGANGFLASHLTESLLIEGNNVSALVRTNSDRVEDLALKYPGQLTITTDLREAVTDAKEIYHLAGFFSTRSDSSTVSKLVDQNLLATLRLYEAIEEFAPDAHTVLASSFSQLSSTGECVPDSYYSGLKALVELGTPALQDRLSFLRVSDTYGPNDSRPKVHNICLKALQTEGSFTFKSPADKELALTHVDDVASAFIFLCRSRIPRAFNLLNSELKITLGQLAENLQQGAGGSVGFTQGNSINTIPFDTNKIPGWSPQHDAKTDLFATLTEQND